MSTFGGKVDITLWIILDDDIIDTGQEIERWDVKGITYLLPSSTNTVKHTTVSNGIWVEIPESDITVQAFLTSAGGTAEIKIHQSNTTRFPPSESTRMMTITLTGVNDMAPLQSKPNASCLYKCAEISNISGGAEVEVLVGG